MRHGLAHSLSSRGNIIVSIGIELACVSVHCRPGGVVVVVAVVGVVVGNGGQRKGRTVSSTSSTHLGYICTTSRRFTCLVLYLGLLP